MLVSGRYERASLIVTSNKRFSAWGETFGDDMAAVAMVDRLIHHAELISLKGDSYRPKDRDSDNARPGPGHPPTGAPAGISLRSPRLGKRARPRRGRSHAPPPGAPEVHRSASTRVSLADH